MTNIRWQVLLVSFAMLSCSTAFSEKVEDGGIPAPENNDGSSRPSAPDGSVAELREKILKQIADSTCPELCAEEEVVIEPAPLSPNSAGQRILVIDEAVVTAAATRYRSRTAAFVAVADEGDYREFKPTLQISKDAYDILQSIDEFPHPVSAEQLEVLMPFVEKFSDHLPGVWGHGMDIFAFLAEMIPDAQFVVSDTTLSHPLREGETLCELGDPERRDAAFAILAEKVETMSASLIDIVEKYDINYIHLSWGLTADDVSSSRCDRPVDPNYVEQVLELYLDLFHDLSSLTVPTPTGERPTLLFQAGTAAPFLLKEDEPDYLVDCTYVPGRVRTSAAAYAGFDVPLEGSYDYSLLLHSLANARACNDLFVVMGMTSVLPGRPVRAKHFPSFFLGLGVSRPAWPPTSSFANPIALAHFVSIANQHPESSTDVWLELLTREWSTPIIDPLWHDQLLVPVPQGADEY